MLSSSTSFKVKFLNEIYSIKILYFPGLAGIENLPKSSLIPPVITSLFSVFNNVIVAYSKSSSLSILEITPEMINSFG